MTSWWKAAAIFAAWLALGVSAQAQSYTPQPVGAARMVEPLGYKPAPSPDLMPGPISPLVAPMGPPDCLSLPSSHSSAFQCENFPCEKACYGSIGGMGLVRYKPGTLPLAFNDSPFTLDTGFIPNMPLPGALDLKDLHPSMWAGARATLGFLWGDQAVEITGFYQSPQTNSREVVGQGQFFVPFFTPSGALPLGFEGDNGLFRQADLVQLSYRTSVGSAELNYRRWDIAINGVELILGVRYFYDRENLSLYTNDDALAVNSFGQSNPLLAATYSVITKNQILGPQIGAEYSVPVPGTCYWLWFTGMAKGMVGANWIQRQWSLTRGDLFQAFNITKNDVKVGQVYETSLTFDAHVLERLRLRVGYTALWAVGVSTPANEFDYNLATQGFHHPQSGSAFWHGPIAEIQFLW
jgi:hypothetical protein